MKKDRVCLQVGINALYTLAGLISPEASAAAWVHINGNDLESAPASLEDSDRRMRQRVRGRARRDHDSGESVDHDSGESDIADGVVVSEPVTTLSPGAVQDDASSGSGVDSSQTQTQTSPAASSSLLSAIENKKSMSASELWDIHFQAESCGMCSPSTRTEELGFTELSGVFAIYFSIALLATIFAMARHGSNGKGDGSNGAEEGGSPKVAFKSRRQSAMGTRATLHGRGQCNCTASPAN